MIRLAHRYVLVSVVLALLAACGSTPSTGGTTGSAAASLAASSLASTEASVAASTEASSSASTAASMAASTEASAAASTEASAAASSVAGGNLSGDIPIGFAFALTGPAAIYGTSQKNAVQLAVDEINGSGMLGGAKLKAVIEDEKGTPEGANTTFNKLINEDKVVAIVGPTLSNAAKSSDPIAQQAKVPVLGVSNTAAGITEIGDYIFRDSLPESAVIPNTIKVAKGKLNLKRVALMYANDDAFSKSGYDVFKKALQDNGIEIADEETFGTNDTDFSAQLTKINGLNPKPDALVVSALAQPAAGILTQAKQLGVTAPVIGGNGFNSPQLSQLAGDAANGVIAGAAWIVTGDTPKNKAFVDAYNKQYSKNPDQFAAQAYAGVYLLAEAIKNAGSTDRTAIRDALGKLTNVDTVLGSFSFENREPRHTPIVQQLENGKFKLFQ